ncbi:L-threonylcarbamoyladenylate synthase [Malassezia brasiliensis]|uniref:L-threonylcarbamoyladenylate synthase n=1 Tax=Malassezia brasiliensis TaxID=1821822 RepID=A0AAF0DUS6_9BASI|nr:L-threonylcarbamoyladenylate synthase [Malassezia brasiliensis]
MKYRHYSPEARVVLVRYRPQAASLTEVLSSQLASIAEAAAEANDATGVRRRTGHGRIGVMCAIDSPVFTCVSHLASEPLQPWAASSKRVSPVVNCGPHQLCVYSLGVQSEPSTAAQRLFDGLRTLDTDISWAGEPSACDLILVEEIPDTGIGLAVMNRLQKAATGIIEVGSV